MSEGAAGICMDPAAALKTSHQAGTLDMPDMAPDKVPFLRVFHLLMSFAGTMHVRTRKLWLNRNSCRWPM